MLLRTKQEGAGFQKLNIVCWSSRHKSTKGLKLKLIDKSAFMNNLRVSGQFLYMECGYIGFYVKCCDAMQNMKTFMH